MARLSKIRDGKHLTKGRLLLDRPWSLRGAQQLAQGAGEATLEAELAKATTRTLGDNLGQADLAGSKGLQEGPSASPEEARRVPVDTGVRARPSNGLDDPELEEEEPSDLDW